MRFPDYQDFLEALTPDKIEQILSDAKTKCSESSKFGSCEQISAISWTISLELLALYHKWIEESLQEF